MPSPIPVAAPASYAPLSAIGYAEADSTLSAVSLDKPLPVSPVTVPGPAALTGTATGASQVGPFAPIAGRAVILALSGTWSGTVRILRSADGGTTRLPVTAAGLPWGVFTGNCCEPVWEDSVPGALLYLDIALTSGSVAYRVAQ